MLPVRINLLFFTVFVLFTFLILRLGVIQLVKGEDYQLEVERTENLSEEIPVPRGKMIDRNGKVIVNNLAIRKITYTKRKGTTSDELLNMAITLTG